METTPFSIDTLIRAVEKRPELWDHGSDLYRDRLLKKKAWKDVCRILVKDFDSKPPEERFVIDKTVFCKWRSVRDGYVKSLKKQAEKQKDGRRHAYVYADLLTFMDPLLRRNAEEGGDGRISATDDDSSSASLERPTQEKTESADAPKPAKFPKLDEIQQLPKAPVVVKPIKVPLVLKQVQASEAIKPIQAAEAMKPVQKSAAINQIPAPKVYAAPKAPEVAQERPTPRKKRKIESIDQVEKSIMDYIKKASASIDTRQELSLQNDEDMLFLRSLLPWIKRLGDLKKLEFRIKVMQLLQSMSPCVDTEPTMMADCAECQSMLYSYHGVHSSMDDDGDYHQPSTSKENNTKDNINLITPNGTEDSTNHTTQDNNQPSTEKPVESLISVVKIEPPDYD